jgi:hypothetical protein
LVTEAGDNGDSQSHIEGASGDSLDNQVDRYLAQYENDSKKGDGEMTGGSVSTQQAERMDWRDLIGGILIEAGDEGDDDDADDDKSAALDAPDADGPPKLGLDNIDVARFADNVVRLIKNYDSLLEVQATLMRRAESFLTKTYDDEVVKAYQDVLRDDHGMEPGEDHKSLNADKYPAPAADRAAGSAEAGAGGAGG